ncbi:hypothetical protein M9H77_14370 [Catharanthus roseus]|uniref:Uncharacterized protein n=1 Tax=Catharanthus roseus TaxID=4058 RepID=A0ACC0BN51_CATRO|nr:hypothetical protein M9H77_14370 [Catharanthus roseus]
MAGTNELHSQQPQGTDCTFEWDENSQLYYHSSSGFYYNPQDGWYYSSRDGLYYKFENGNYVLLDLNLDEGNQCEKAHDFGEMGSKKFDEDKQCSSVNCFNDGERLAEAEAPVTDEPTQTDLECAKNYLTEDPRPPSEWLEDTLIELFLSGYPTQVDTTASNVTGLTETNGAGENDIYNELEEGEWIPDESHGSTDTCGTMPDEGVSWEEENWLAQYGQVTEQNEESVSNIQVIDLWDWEMVREATKNTKVSVSKLVGRLVKGSSKLHPSLPSSGSRLKTASICEVHLDLVRVRSGQIYRLRRPSRQYLASLSAYDSSNPTGDWGFPQLCVDKNPHPLERFDGPYLNMKTSSSSEHPHEFKKERSVAYRDRAAERRALHGGFGVGPGQKKSSNDVDSSPTPVSPEEATTDSLNISFGEGSYARKLLKSMGWKEGEALGKSNKGLLEPLQAIGNKGNAGLGWDNNKKKHKSYSIQ